jgi:hypothetical protein
MVHPLMEYPPETDTEIDVARLEGDLSGGSDSDPSPPEELE